MDRQWPPSSFSSNPPPSSPPPLHDEFSRLSLTGSGSASQFPNLPIIPNFTNSNTNTNAIINNNNNTNNFFDLNQLQDELTSMSSSIRSRLPPTSHDIILPNTLSGPPSFHPNPIINHNINIPSSWMGSGPGLGSGSGPGLGSGFVTPLEHYHAMLAHRNEVVRPVLGNNHSNHNNNNNNNDYDYNYVYHCNLMNLLYTSLLSNNHNNFLNHQINNNHRRYYSNNVVNYNNNYYNNSRRGNPRPPSTPRAITMPNTTRTRGPVVMMSWEEIKGKVVIYAKDEELSKMMMNKFDLGQMEGLRMVISEIKEGLISLLMNSYGIFFFKKLLRLIDHQDVVEILKALVANQRDFLRVSLDSAGTMGVQELVDYLDPDSLEEKAIVMNALRGGVAALAKNMNGFYCIKALRKVYQFTGPIMNEVADHCVEIAMDKSGCCVLQNCIEVRVPEREPIICEVINHALELSENDYGNYVVQYVIGLKEWHNTHQILRALQGYLIRLTKNKFGSHVVEKLFSHSSEDDVEFMMNEIFNENDDANFLEILQHPTGNYVAQSALKRTRDMHLKQGGGNWSLYRRFVGRIEDKYAFLHSHVHGQRVLSLVKSQKFR